MAFNRFAEVDEDSEDSEDSDIAALFQDVDTTGSQAICTNAPIEDLPSVSYNTAQ